MHEEPHYEHDGAAAWPPPEQERFATRRAMVRRLRWLLVTSLAGFCLIVWALVNSESRLSSWFATGPSRVVRQHLEALSRGEAREAYDFFSKKYRGEIPYRAFERLVVTHREMFRTRLLAVKTPSQGEGFAVLDTRLASASGAQYIARFTLVRIEGRWWIDQIRWSQAPDASQFIRT
jgi:hypothetical protein